MSESDSPDGLTEAQREEIRELIRDEQANSATITRRDALKGGGLLAGLAALGGGATGSAAADLGDGGGEALAVGSATANTYRITANRYGGADAAKSELVSELDGDDAGAKFSAEDTGALYHWDGSGWVLMPAERESINTDEIVSNSERTYKIYKDADGDYHAIAKDYPDKSSSSIGTVLQNAIDEIGQDEGATFFFRRGVYDFSGDSTVQIIDTHSITLLGETYGFRPDLTTAGVTFKTTTTDHDLLEVGGTSGGVKVRGFKMENIKLFGPGTGGTATGIRTYRTDVPQLVRCAARNWATAIHFDDENSITDDPNVQDSVILDNDICILYNATKGQISDSMIDNADTYGVDCDGKGKHFLKIDNCTFNVHNGTAIRNLSALSISNSDFFNNTGAACIESQNKLRADITSKDNNAVVIEDISGDSNIDIHSDSDDNPIKVLDANNVNIGGNIINPTNDGILLIDAENCVVEDGMVIRDGGAAGVALILDSKDNVIKGRIHNNSGVPVKVRDTDVLRTDIEIPHLEWADITDDGTTTTLNGVGRNSGDPTSTGDWNGSGFEGLKVRDTTNNNTYLYNNGTYSQIASS